jgi:DNA-binding winged helix-turn-helix (wHTH) protein
MPLRAPSDDLAGEMNETGIDLATAGELDLSGLRIEPARRLVSWEGGTRELEPRVMKVLVALASAPGEVVSRDRLIELCWDGRIVGDDAINRCIQALRRLGREIEPPPFAIETVARVGYSLSVAESEGGRQPPAAAPRERAGRAARPLFLLGALTLAGAFILAVVLWGERRGNQPPKIAVAAEGGGASAELARGLGTDMMRLAGAHVDEIAMVDTPSEADFVVRISAGRAGAIVRANLSLVRNAGSELLWSRSSICPRPRSRTFGRRSPRGSTMFSLARSTFRAAARGSTPRRNGCSSPPATGSTRDWTNRRSSSSGRSPARRRTSPRAGAISPSPRPMPTPYPRSATGNRARRRPRSSGRRASTSAVHAASVPVWA